jgi:hypothetical protein
MVSFLDDYPTALRDFGVPVSIRSGWRTMNRRGNWTHGVPVGTLDHHFVINYTSPEMNAITMLENGYSGAPTPPVVGQYLGTTQLFLICGFPTGHPGTGSRRVLNDVLRDVAPTGDAAARGLPNDLPQGEAEKMYFGTEVHHPGTAVPLRDNQVDWLARADAAFCQVLGYTSARVIQHREHTNRKIDIHRDALNAAAHRSRVAALIGASRPPVAEPDWWSKWWAAA